MKTLKFVSMLFIVSVLCCGFVSCSDDDSNDDNNPTEINYASVIPGHWENTGVADDITETLSINYKGTGTIAFYDLVDNDWGIMAYGTYTLSENKLIVSYTDVTVLDSNYKATTYHGFTDGMNKTINYTIQSCDGKKLVLKDDSGKTLNYEKYADLK